MSKKKTKPKPIPRDRGTHGNTPPKAYLRQRYKRMTLQFKHGFAGQLEQLSEMQGRSMTQIIVDSVREKYSLPDVDE